MNIYHILSPDYEFLDAICSPDEDAAFEAAVATYGVNVIVEMQEWDDDYKDEDLEEWEDDWISDDTDELDKENK